MRYSQKSIVRLACKSFNETWYGKLHKMLTGSACSVTGGAKRRYVAVDASSYMTSSKGRVSPSRMTFLNLFRVACWIRTNTNAGTSIYLWNAHLQSFASDFWLFASCEYHAGIRDREPDYGDEALEIIVANFVRRFSAMAYLQQFHAREWDVCGPTPNRSSKCWVWYINPLLRTSSCKVRTKPQCLHRQSLLPWLCPSHRACTCKRILVRGDVILVCRQVVCFLKNLKRTNACLLYDLVSIHCLRCCIHV